MTLAEAAAQISSAKRAEDLFGELPDGDGHEAIHDCYRRFAKVVHPDGCEAEEQQTAHDAFVRLHELYQEAERRLTQGEYGKKPRVVLAGKAEYELGDIAYVGDIADVYTGSSLKKGKPVLVKVTRQSADNDLLTNEAHVLAHLGKKAKKFTYLKYLPTLLETMNIRDEAGNIRQANIFAAPEGYYTLEEVHQAYPQGVDPRDLAWMLNRILEITGFAHAQGVIHGAINPKHCLIHPESHALLLVDWCFSGMADSGLAKVLAIVPQYEGWYPPEVKKGKPATPGTDTYMAARLGIYLLGGDAEKGEAPKSAPPRLMQFLKGCLIDNPAYRPGDVWQLHDDLAEVLRALFGPKKFHPFAMPNR